jgi:hypothetical protein
MARLTGLHHGGVSLALAFALGACTTGPMNVREAHYFAVPNGENTNYYRLRVDAETRLGVAGYRSGWFPARAVDRLFGEVTSEAGAAEVDVRTKIETEINARILETTKSWLEEAVKPDADSQKLDRLLAARRRVLAYPSSLGEPYPKTFEIEHNPSVGVATRYADEKLVFVLGSNPDEVIGRIASFVEDDKTVLTINRLSGVITQSRTNQIASREARQDLAKDADSRVHRRIQEALKAATVTDALSQVETLLILLEALYP